MTIPPPPARLPPPEAAPPPPNNGARTATRSQRTALVLGGAAALLAALWLFSAILTPFVLAGVIAYFLDPPTTRLTRLGMPRSIAAFLLLLLLLTFVAVAGLLLYPLLLSQIGVLLARLPAYISTIGTKLRDAMTALEEQLGPDLVDSQLRELAVGQVGAVLSYLGTSAARFVGGSIQILSVFTLLVVTPVCAFYLLRDWPFMIARLESWLPRRSASVLRRLSLDTDRVLSAWLRGQLICCAILAAFYAVALSAIGLELGLLVGLLAGVLSFIPYLGSITGFATAILLAMGQWGTANGVGLVVMVFVFGQVVEGYIIYPRLLGDRVELHAVWVIFALFAGGVAFGSLGVLLAVPMAAAIGVVARYWLRRYLASPLYLDPPRTGT
ncbi:AI-2E family transporter [Humitalea rosea]|uniref:AI-2E family transporter n=1 Tax=Humitalea rosea TaxID=990373 RepID=UPI001FE31C04|nr:AI-2E family transporter [Humitalea rosea]